MDVTLKMTADEAKFVVFMLSELPTKSNAWPLMKKLEDQVNNQVQPEKTE